MSDLNSKTARSIAGPEPKRLESFALVRIWDGLVMRGEISALDGELLCRHEAWQRQELKALRVKLDATGGMVDSFVRSAGLALSPGEPAERVRETLEGIWKRCRVWQVEEWGEQAKAEPVTFGEVQDAADEARLARVAETLEQAEAYRAENGVLWALVEEFEGRIQEWSDDDSAGIGVGASICGEFLDRVYGLRSDLGRLKKTPAEASGLEEKCSELEALPGIDLLRYWRDEFPRPGVKVLEVMTVEELEAVRAEWWRRVEKSAIWEACRVVARTLGDHRPGEHGCFYVFVEEPDPARFPGVNLRVEAHKTVGEGEVFVHWSEFHPGDPSNECRCVLDNFAEVVTPGVWMDYLLAAYERAIGVKAEASAKEYARRRESLVADMRLASEGA